jgi:hypothetical protein
VRKVSTTLLVLSACVLGAALSLFGMNFISIIISSFTNGLMCCDK